MFVCVCVVDIWSYLCSVNFFDETMNDVDVLEGKRRIKMKAIERRKKSFHPNELCDWDQSAYYWQRIWGMKCGCDSSSLNTLFFFLLGVRKTAVLSTLSSVSLISNTHNVKLISNSSVATGSVMHTQDTFCLFICRVYIILPIPSIWNIYIFFFFDTLIWMLVTTACAHPPSRLTGPHQ